MCALSNHGPSFKPMMCGKREASKSRHQFYGEKSSRLDSDLLNQSISYEVKLIPSWSFSRCVSELQGSHCQSAVQ